MDQSKRRKHPEACVDKPCEEAKAGKLIIPDLKIGHKEAAGETLTIEDPTTLPAAFLSWIMQQKPSMDQLQHMISDLPPNMVSELKQLTDTVKTQVDLLHTFIETTERKSG